MSAQPDSNKLRADFRRDGYVVLRGFLSPLEMTELWREIRRYVNEVVPKLPSDQNFYETRGQPETLKYCKDMARHDAYFRKVFESDRFVKLAETLLGGPVIGTTLSMFNKPPRIGEETLAATGKIWSLATPRRTRAALSRPGERGYASTACSSFNRFHLFRIASGVTMYAPHSW